MRVVTSEYSDQYVAVHGKKSIQIFDLNNASQPKYTYDLNNQIYDHIMDISLNPEKVFDSWVTFVSKEFFFVQFMQIEEIIAQ